MFEDRTFDKTLMEIRNETRNVPRTEPCKTPAIILVHEESYPFHTARCFQLSKKSCKIFLRFPSMPFCSNLNMTLSFQTLSQGKDV